MNSDEISFRMVTVYKKETPFRTLDFRMKTGPLEGGYIVPEIWEIGEWGTPEHG